MYQNRLAMQSSSNDFSTVFEENPFQPFDLKSVMGFDARLGVRCLPNEENETLLFAMGQAASIFDLKAKTERSILGHDHRLVAIEHDKKGRFILTADKECAIVWDLKCTNLKNPTPLRMISKPFGDTLIEKAAISPCGKYLVVTSTSDNEQNSRLQIWLWSFGNFDPDGQYVFSSKYGSIKTIRFSVNSGEEEFFAVTMEHVVAFGYWNVKKSILEIHLSDKKLFKSITGSSYILNSRCVTSITDRGQILIWSDVFTNNPSKPISNRKNFLKLISQKRGPVTDIQVIDNYVVTVDETGDIRFYDTDMKLMFVCTFWSLPGILSLSPMPFTKKYRIVDEDDEELKRCSIDKNDEEIVYRTKLHTDFTIEANPFIARDFAITTITGEIVLCNVVRKTTEYILYHCEDIIVAIEHHPSQPWILGCNRVGRLFYYDYNLKLQIKKHFLEPHWITKDDKTREQINSVVSCLKISTCECFLAVGFENGSLMIMAPVTFTPFEGTPLQCSKNSIQFIKFSYDGQFCTYADSNHNCILLAFDDKWFMVGKYRYHCKPIVNLIFIEFESKKSLISIAQDRFYVEYDLIESIANQSLILRRDFRLEQFAVITMAKLLPSSAILQKDTSSSDQVILTADDGYKFKIYDPYTLENLFTFVGPIFDSPIIDIKYHLPTDDFNESFLIVCSEKTLGIVTNPIDGNPFRYSGVVVDSRKIKQISMTLDNKNVIVLGYEDTGETIWEIKKRNALEYLKSGGEGLLPFCSLLPGGKNGWLFKEMQDMFFYIQIMKEGLQSLHEIHITDYIPITELTDFMRGIGFFPSEYEQRNLINEATRVEILTTEVQQKICFEDVIKMYLNHKPITGYRIDDIIKAVQFFASEENEKDSLFSDRSEDECQLLCTNISLEKIFEILTQKGEVVSPNQAMKYLVELLGSDVERLNENKMDLNEALLHDFSNLQQDFDIEGFCEQLLGLQISKTKEGNITCAHGDVLDPSVINHELDNLRYSMQIDIDTEESEQILE